MSDRVYTKNLLGMEDLVTTETSEQTRNGTTVTLTGVTAANISCKDSKSILEYINFLENRIATLEAGNMVNAGGTT